MANNPPKAKEQKEERNVRKSMKLNEFIEKFGEADWLKEAHVRVLRVSPKDQK